MKTQTAFVTGAAQGLGKAIAQALFESGRSVVLADIDPEVESVAAAMDNTGARVTGYCFDVCSEESFQTTFGRAVERFGAVDIMVNNAARTVSRSVWDISCQEWDDVLAINLRGVFFGCRIAGRHMRDRASGRIVNLSSIAGQQGSPATGAHYGASKAGILALTKVFAQELGPDGVTVNAVAPSAISSPAIDTVSPEKIAAVLASVPLNRLGRPEEVSAAVLYLVSDMAGYVTGATIDVNGGRLMR